MKMHLPYPWLAVVAAAGLIVAAPMTPAAQAQQQQQLTRDQLLEQFDTAREAGDQHMQDGNYDEAISSYSQALQIGKRFSDAGQIMQSLVAYISRAKAFAALEDYGAALKDYKNAMDLSPEAIDALVGRGEIYQELGAVELALNDFQQAVELDRTNAAAVFGLGKAQVLGGLSADGVRNLDRALKMEGLEDRQHEAFRVRAQGKSAQGKLDEALADIQQSLALDPDDYETHFTHGTILLQNEKYEDALFALQNALNLFQPKEDGLPFTQGFLTKSATHVELGKSTENEQLRQQTYKDAVADCDELLKLLPDTPAMAAPRAAAWHSKGVAQRLQGNFGDAIKSFSEAIELNPELGESYFRRGICFHYIDEDALAIADFEKAAVVNFEDPRARLWEGIAYADLGDWHEAVRAFGLAIAKSERYTPAYVNRGLAYMQLGEYQKAVDNFNEAIRLEPTEAEHYFKRGLAHSLLGNSEKAASSFSNAIQFDDQHVNAHRRLSQEMARLGRGELADQYRNQAEQMQLQPPISP